MKLRKLKFRFGDLYLACLYCLAFLAFIEFFLSKLFLCSQDNLNKRRTEQSWQS